MLKPLFKWTGGKRREIKHFGKYYPEITKGEFTFIEPFVGGGAVYWDINAPKNIINDIDTGVINFYKQLRENPSDIIEVVKDLQEKMAEISAREKTGNLTFKEAKEERGKYYYHWRDMDRENGLESMTDIEKACRFIIVNQLAFNGMRRFNKKGEFNVPYGNYKNLNFTVTEDHLDLLDRTEILNESFEDVMRNSDREDCFIYLDPPYTRKFKEYNHKNVFGYERQIDLANCFKSLENAKCMLVINKDHFTEDVYRDYIKDEYYVKYSTNIKNRFNKEVKHLVVTNY